MNAPITFHPIPVDQNSASANSFSQSSPHPQSNPNPNSNPNSNPNPNSHQNSHPNSLSISNQAYSLSPQTHQQVAAILSMPPTVLAQLARTADDLQQQRILIDSHLDHQILNIMRLPPPDPNTPTHPPGPRPRPGSDPGPGPSPNLNPDTNPNPNPNSLPSPPPIQHSHSEAISHPAIPLILHQAFSPNSAAILAPVTQLDQHTHDYQPSYRSVDEWAIQVAQQTALDQHATLYIANLLKQWALHSQDSQLEQHVRESQANAVLLAAKAEAVVQTAHSNGGQLAPITQTNFNSPDFFPDLTPYANTYKNQLATIASGYYTRLHRQAINKLNQNPICPEHQNIPQNLNSNLTLTQLQTKSQEDQDPNQTHHQNQHQNLNHHQNQSLVQNPNQSHHLTQPSPAIDLRPSIQLRPPSLVSSLSAASPNSRSSPASPPPSHSLPKPAIPSPLPSATCNNHPSITRSNSVTNHPPPLCLSANSATAINLQPSSPHPNLGPPLPSPFSSSAPLPSSTPLAFNQAILPSIPIPPSSHPNGTYPSSSTMITTLANNTNNEPPSASIDKLNSRNVQAAAVAALTANVMAATEIATRAGQTLSTLGMTVHTNLTTPLPPPGPAAIAATQQSLALVHHHQQQQQQHHHHQQHLLSVHQHPSAAHQHSLALHHHSSQHLPPLQQQQQFPLQQHQQQHQLQIQQPSNHPASATFLPNDPAALGIPNSAASYSLPQNHSSHRPISALPAHLRSPRNSLPNSNQSAPPSNPVSPLGRHLLVPTSLGSSQNAQSGYSTQVEKMWRSAQEGQCTERARDCLLSYAHAAYSKKTNDPCLLPLLHTLVKLHPRHLPTLLLLSCVYYSQGDYVSSLFHNDQILSIDPEYVEAMSNVGTTQRALGKWAEAEDWWWRAIRLRPTYFDAFDNLLGVLCNPQPPPAAPHHNIAQPPPSQPRYAEALRLCEFVESALFGPPEQLLRPIRLPSTIPPTHVHRVQNLFYAKGNLLIASNKPDQARDEYEKALEVVCGPPMPRTAPPATGLSSGGYSLVDLVLTVTSMGLFMMSLNATTTNSPTDPAALKTLSDTGIWDPAQDALENVLADPLKAAQQRRQTIRSRLLKLGGGILPCVLLLPDSLDQLVAMVFNGFGRLLPVFQNHLPPASGAPATEPNRNPALQSPNQTTSTVLLTLAKCLQDAISAPAAAGGPSASLDGIPPSASLLLSLYYVAITLHPSPSTCNNLGILLSTIPSVLTIQHPTQGRRVMNGQQIAHMFYVQGLQKDRNHPHLYTNLGSLLKDMGQLAQAVSMYEKAVQCNPNFDVALANLANAIKDMGRVQESVQWYMRAVAINPNFPEAVCGLVNALGGVCDWRDRGAVGNEPVVDRHGKLLGPPAPAADGKLRAGLMGKVSCLVDKQLDEGMSYGKGVMRQTASLEQWLEALAIVKTGRADGLSKEERDKWRGRLGVFCGPVQDALLVGGRMARFNEGGFLIRLVERCTRQIQRRWYVDKYGVEVCRPRGPPAERIGAGGEGAAGGAYRRLALPSALAVPPVPTVLPFHTFTYPLTARECRLISHRNALRISLTALTQPWMPATVYPPPPPPCPLFPSSSEETNPALPRLTIGYVSSDFNNHPLAHLMQSVFGLHNRAEFKVICYGLCESDGSIYRKKIEQEVEVFKEVSGWSCEEIVREIGRDGVHVLVNLNGYTKGARNDIFAARPCPVQIEFMGFAGTLASGWTDWIVADPIVCPPRMVSGEKWRRRHHLSTTKAPGGPGRQSEEPRMVELVEDGPSDFEGDLDPECGDEDWVYTEKFIYMPHSYFVCDHKQGFREENGLELRAGLDLNGVPVALKCDPGSEEDEGQGGVGEADEDKEERRQGREWEVEELKRWKMRREMFGELDEQTVIFANFNQLYKIDPLIFKYWLEILAAVPNSILWLLRFPAPGEPHLKVTAERWAGREVAGRIRFTDVAPKPVHIQRGRIADLFLDSTECNAHTTAADILWSGTPILTLPRATHAHKMCSRVAASIALATGYGSQMVATSMEDYKARAVGFARSVEYERRRARTGEVYLSGKLVGGGLQELRRRLFFNRERSALFDTARWTANLEKGFWEAWKRFVEGTDCEENREWRELLSEEERGTCSIWVEDEGGNEEVRRAREERKRFMMRQEEAWV